MNMDQIIYLVQLVLIAFSVLVFGFSVWLLINILAYVMEKPNEHVDP